MMSNYCTTYTVRNEIYRKFQQFTVRYKIQSQIIINEQILKLNNPLNNKQEIGGSKCVKLIKIRQFEDMVV
jgi:hypothetical protein